MPNLNDQYFYHFKQHTTCGTNPFEKSVTEAGPGDTLSDQRQGSWNFWSHLGQPGGGEFVVWQGICWEFIDWSQDPSTTGLMEWNVTSPSGTLSSTGTTCAGCVSQIPATITYHAWELCNTPGTYYFGVDGGGALTTVDNDLVYVGMGSPSPGQVTVYNGLCQHYVGQYEIGASGVPLGGNLQYMSSTTPYETSHTYHADCLACNPPPATFHKWKQCTSATEVNVVALGSSNTSAESIAFYTAAGSPNQYDVINFDTSGTTSNMCYMYMGDDVTALAAVDTITLGTTATYLGSTQNPCADCITPPTSGCTDPAAINYNASATTDDGSCTYSYGCTDPLASNYNSLATIDDGTCTYCTYGCTDPTAGNYDPLATCDDGSCLVVQGGTGCDILFGSETCQPDGTSTINIDLSTGGGLSNVVTTVDGTPYGTSTGCTTPPVSIPVTGLTEGQTVKVVAECSYSREDFDRSGGGAEPSWAVPVCGESEQVISNETKVYCFYDGTSLGVSEARNAYKTVMEWLLGLSDFTVDTTHGSSTQNVFHSCIAGERWLDWAITPMTGKYSNSQTPQAATYKWTGGGSNNNVVQNVNFSHCDAGTDCYMKRDDTTNLLVANPYGKTGQTARSHKILNWAYDTATTNGIDDPNLSWTVDPFYDSAQVDPGGTGAGRVGAPMPDGSQSSGNNASQLFIGPAPTADPNTDDILVICFADESTIVYTGEGNSFDNDTSYSGGNVVWGSLNTGQPTQSWKDDYTEFISRRNTYIGTAGKTFKAFLYPSEPTGSSSSHNAFPLHALATISSGNKTMQDGMWQTGTAPANSLVNLNTIETENPYWTGNTPTWGGLDQQGWGVNVAEVPFTPTIFIDDLSDFLGSGSTQTMCNDNQCLIIKAVDDSGGAVMNHPITVNGVSVGTTNANGTVSHTLTGPGPAIINDCFTFTAVGNCIQSLITVTLSEAQITTALNCVLGCTDPTSWNYNPLAGVDDGSCMHPLEEDPRDLMSRCELLKIDTECNFATDVYNLYKNKRYGLDPGCLYNMDGRASKKYSSDWVDKLLPDYGDETFSKTLHTKDATPKPDWVVTACGEASKDLTLYFMYDTTSLSQQKVTSARNAVEEWLDDVRATRAANAAAALTNEACQNSDDAGTITAYHTLVAGERWIDWGIFPMTGMFNNFGEFDSRYCGGNDSPSGQYLSGAGLIDAVIPNDTPTCHFWSTLIYDAPVRVWYNAGGSSYTCTTCTGNSNGTTNYNGSFYTGTLNGEPPLPSTDNVLVVAFEDEAANGSSVGTPAKNYHYINSSTTPSWQYAMDGTSGNSAANGVDTASGKKCSTCYMNDYNKFVETYLAWEAYSAERKINFYLYPSAPTNVSATGAHYVFPLHVLGAIHSGDTSPTPNGQLAAAPSNSLATLSAVTSSNPYYTAQNTVIDHVANGKLNSGYGGLDQYGWGTNVAEAAFSKAGFVTDLNEFWSTEQCNDAECIMIRVEDKLGVPVPNYDIVLDGLDVGKTNEFGLLRTCVENASVNTDHKINLCHCFYTTGGCNQQKLKIVVDGIDCDDCGNIKKF